MLKKLSASVLFSMLPFILLMAQDNQPLAHFDGNQTGKVIQLTFVIRAGNQCDGVRILRSVNEKDYASIGQLTGVCGNNSSDETFSFIDISPVKNADNYYKLELVNLKTSDFIKIHFIDFGDKEYVLKPNIVKDKSILYFQNDCNDEFDFVLLDKNGKKMKVLNKQRGNEVALIKGKLKKGNYTFQLLIENKVKISGPVVIE